jgi:hypothetical protein
LLVLAAGAAFADTDERLLRYVGESAEVFIADFGQPDVKTGEQMVYWAKTQIVGGRRGVPEPVGGVGLNGAVSGGVAGQFEPLRIEGLPCEVKVSLAADQSITAVSSDGLGCFEWISKSVK